jgi:hypothetical protein
MQISHTTLHTIYSTIVCYASIGEGCQWTGNCRHYSNGKLIAPPIAFVISEVGGAFILSGCDARWQPITETRHSTLEGAKQQAEFEVRGIGTAWRQGCPTLRQASIHNCMPDLAGAGPMELISYRDEDLVFHLEVVSSYYKITEWCIRNIRRCYPGARVVVVSDGDADPRYNEYMRLGAELEYGEHLYSTGDSGALWRRRFHNFMKRPARFFFRADSDVGFYRRFGALPQTDCIFGSPCVDFIQGGLMGFTSDAINRLISSGILSEPWMRECVHVTDKGVMASDDRAICRAAQTLGIPLVDHHEFHCAWQERVQNSDERYAVIHPCKNGSL